MGNIIESDPTVLAGVRVVTDKRGFDNAVIAVVSTITELPDPNTRYIGALALTEDTDSLYVALPLNDPMKAETWRSVQNETTVWTAVTFESGWINFGGSQQPVQYRKFDDLVQVRGQMKNGTNQASAFTLPVGFRPSMNQAYPVACFNGYTPIAGVIIVNTSGQFFPYVSSNTDVNFFIQYSTTF